MISTDTLYIGIDPTSGNKEFGYAALDDALNVVALEDADAEELLEFLGKQENAYVAINAPAQVNHGLVKRKFEQENPTPRRKFHSLDIRMAEFTLRERGIVIAGTPSREEFCPAWMQLGFILHQRLSDLGFEVYGESSANCQILETHPYAGFCALAESIPLPKPTLEGRLQRQLLLNDRGLRINDAMVFFEEITRFKLIRGNLPTELLYSPEQLDVFVAAYTAWLAATRPDEVSRVGDKNEGQLVLPVGKLQETYKE